jgi:hypothetical protein
MIVRYAEFRDQLEGALRDEGLFFAGVDRGAVEADPRRELSLLAQTFKTALNDWTESICALATWIRYSPPRPGAKPTGPWFDDGGPETTH